MNRYVAIFAVCSLIGLSLARAQAPAPVTVSPSSGGTLTVRNGGTITVIAFALTYDLPLPPAEAGPASAQSWQLYDAATEPLAAQPISGGQEVTVRCHFDCTATPFQLKAVLFQDGTSWGDSGWVQRISTRRAYMEQALQTSIRDLTTALSQGTTREALAAQFQASLSQETSAATDADLKGCIMSTRGVVLTNLQRVVHSSGGTEIPASQVIQHEITSLRARYTSVFIYGGQQ